MSTAARDTAAPGAKIVESGDSRVVTRTPQDSYTQNLLLASPVADPAEQAQRRERWLALRQPALAG